MKDKLFLDLETTGLDPNNDAILEIAAVHVHEDPEGITETLVIDTPVRPYHPVPWCHVNPFVYRMHTDNGLFADVDRRGVPLVEAEDQICAYLHACVGTRLIELAGNSVGSFDLQFIRRLMPGLASRLSHRVFDVSTLITAYRDGSGDDSKEAPTHRALDDVRRSMAWWRRVTDDQIHKPRPAAK